MRKLTFFSFCIMLAISSATAQQNTNSVKGAITDTLNKQFLYKAVVSIVTAKDSMLVKFIRTDDKGKFLLKDLPAGKYVLLATFPNYADYTDTFSITENAGIDLGSIPMITKAHLLQEVIVKQSVAAIRMKGDTMEFKADSFKVQANASVEELLKKMGMQVDKSGQITAYGQKIQKVLVDGEEFFGDDPTLVTQNLRADMVDKVQVFDKTSDQAAFTGVDDGEKVKTLNLKLKDDKKKGYFGKLDASLATEGFYNEQLMFNKFRKKEKFSFYGIFSNTGKTGLSWRDRESYGDNSSTIIYDEASGDSYITSGAGDDLEGWGGTYEGQGYPKVKNGGVHYNNKWGDDKQAINLNYKIMDLSVNGNSATNTQYILPDTLYFINRSQKFANNIIRNKGSLVYDNDFDTTSNIKLAADASYDKKMTINEYLTESLAEDNSLVNRGLRTITTDGDARSFNSSFLWRKKMKKKGRTLSLNGRQNYNENNMTGFLNADNQFYKAGALVSSQKTDQFRRTNTKALLFDVKATYTEPLSAAASLVLNYSVTLNNSSSERSSFNKSSSGKYESLDTAFSNDYTFNVLTHKLGVNYSVIKKKLRYGIGNTTGYTDFTQVDQRNAIEGKRNFVNWFPQAYLSYAFTTQRRINLRYNGSTSQPSLQQIQPLRSNDDPLHIVEGNPSLVPAFRNSVSVNFYDFKTLSGRSIWLNASYNSNNNAFATRDYVDSLGRRVSQTINVNGNKNFYFDLDYGFKIAGANVGINPGFSTARFVNIVNNLHNVTESRNYSMGFYVGKQVEKLYDNSISANVTYTTSESSIQKNVATRYWTYNIRPDLDFFLPWKLQIHTDIDFRFRQRTSVFDNNTNVVLWNAWFGKKMLTGDALVIKISGNDILNQNIGFNRSVNTNFVTQNTYTTIRRYFMLSAVWNFNKGPKPGQP